MKYKQLKTYLVKDLPVDKNGNAIIKLVKGTTHIVLKKGENKMKSGTKQPTLRELIMNLSADMKVVKQDIVGIKEDIVGIKEDIVGIKEDIQAMKNTPTMKAELKENK